MFQPIRRVVYLKTNHILSSFELFLWKFTFVCIGLFDPNDRSRETNFLGLTTHFIKSSLNLSQILSFNQINGLKEEIIDRKWAKLNRKWKYYLEKIGLVESIIFACLQEKWNIFIFFVLSKSLNLFVKTHSYNMGHDKANLQQA